MRREPMPARCVASGRILRRELEARNWTQQDLAAIMGQPPAIVDEIVRGAKEITSDTANGLGHAFGTSSDFWLNLESNYRLFRANS